MKELIGKINPLKPGERIYLDVSIVYWPEKRVVSKYSKILFDPPKKIKINSQADDFLPQADFSLPDEAKPHRDKLLIAWIKDFKMERIKEEMEESFRRKYYPEITPLRVDEM